MLWSWITLSPFITISFDPYNIPRRMWCYYSCVTGENLEILCMNNSPKVELKPRFPGCKLSSFHYFTLMGMIWIQRILHDVKADPNSQSERQTCHLHLCWFNSYSDSEKLTSENDWKWAVEIAFNVAPMNQWFLLIWTVGKSLLIRSRKSSCRKALRVNRALSMFTEGFWLLIWLQEQWAEWKRIPLPKAEHLSKKESGVWPLNW